jgi:hypothetical protein
MNQKPKYYVYTGAKGSTAGNGKKEYFVTLNEAQDFVLTHFPPGPAKGLYHIYPVDKSGYFSKSEGRTSFGAGNKKWEKNQKTK